MRSLFLLSRLHCQNGIASHLATLLPLLRNRGWSVSVVAGLLDAPPENAGRLDTIRAACDVFEVDPALSNARSTSPTSAARQARAVHRWRKKVRPDVIHLQGRALGPPTLMDRWLGGPPRVYTKHLGRQPTSVPPAMRSATHALWGDRAIGISRAVARGLTADEGFPAADLRYVPHGIDLAHFRPPTADERAAARRALGVPPDAFACVQLARVLSLKRPDTLVRACLALRRAGLPAVAVLAGQFGTAERDWIGSIAAADPAGVLLLGERDARTAVWAADVSVLCSEREGFPISVVEAMACGVPAVRTDTEGSVDQIEDGSNGLLFGVGDEEALVGHLTRLAADPSLRAAMAARGRETVVARFGFDRMADRTVAVYRELCDGAPPDPDTVVQDLAVAAATPP